MEKRTIYKNPGLPDRPENLAGDANYYRIALGCGYHPCERKKMVGDNLNANPKPNTQAVIRR